MMRFEPTINSFSVLIHLLFITIIMAHWIKAYRLYDTARTNNVLET